MVYSLKVIIVIMRNISVAKFCQNQLTFGCRRIAGSTQWQTYRVKAKSAV